jgi:hypothetical protein
LICHRSYLCAAVGVFVTVGSSIRGADSALDGLGALAPKTTSQLPEVIRALKRITADRNPRLAGKAQELLRTAYWAPAG